MLPEMKKKTLILGAAGMLGHVLFDLLSVHEGLDVYATVRSSEGLAQWFPERLMQRVRGDVNANVFSSVESVLNAVKPDVVINCIGIIKQLPESMDPITSITVNSLFPHQLAAACSVTGARMIHLSTDCVFSGARGMYREDDRPDAEDLYGRSKLLGEVDYPHCITLRTSIIGHELRSRHGLIEWFLSQKGSVKGFANAVFSGLTTVEMARVIADFVMPQEALSGLYHLSSDPISKYDLLRQVAGQYGKQIKIERYEDLQIDRSLDSARFRKAAGYTPLVWPELVAGMHGYFNTAFFYRKRRIQVGRE